MEKALSNHVILNEIFNNLHSPTCLEKYLKTARLVCRKWNEVLLTHKPIKFALKFFFERKPIPKLDRRLARSVYIVHMLDDDSKKDTDDNLLAFFVKYGEEIKELDFTDDKYDFLLNIFQHQFCPNLEKLRASVSSCPEDIYERLPRLKGLKSLTMYSSGRNAKDQKNAPKHFKNLVQTFLNSAQNLEELELFNNCFVDLSNNKKLKKLKHDTKELIDKPKLLQMLKQTSSGLEKLSLNSDYDEDKEGHKKNQYLLNLPKMPKLTYLSLSGIDDSQVGRNLNNIRPSVLPNLKILKLTNRKKELSFLQELDETYDFQHDEVVTLKLAGVKQPELLRIVQLRFPNLEMLNVSLYSKKKEGDEEVKESEEEMEKNDQQIVTLLEACAQLELKHLRILIPFEFHFEIVTLALHLEQLYESLFYGGMQTFQMDKLTTSIEDQTYGWNPESITALKEIATFVKNRPNLDVYLHQFLNENGKGFQKVMEYVEEENIPVQFTCNQAISLEQLNKYVPSWVLCYKLWFCILAGCTVYLYRLGLNFVEAVKIFVQMGFYLVCGLTFAQFKNADFSVICPVVKTWGKRRQVARPSFWGRWKNAIKDFKIGGRKF